jgi:hypothetical protein
MYTWTINAILAKRWLWLPDDGLYKPKRVGATVKILNVLVIHILIKFVCISWTIKNFISFQSSGVKNPKENLLSQYEVYIRKSVGIEKSPPKESR